MRYSSAGRHASRESRRFAEPSATVGIAADVSRARAEIFVQLDAKHVTVMRPGSEDRGKQHRGGNSGQNCPPLHTLPHALLFRELPRPGERRLRQVDDGRGPSASRTPLSASALAYSSSPISCSRCPPTSSWTRSARGYGSRGSCFPGESFPAPWRSFRTSPLSRASAPSTRSTVSASCSASRKPGFSQA